MFGQKRLQNSNLNRGLIECFVLCCFVLYFKTLFEVYSSVHVHTVHRMEHSITTIREVLMGVGDGVASVIMLTFTKRPVPHAAFYKEARPSC